MSNETVISNRTPVAKARCPECDTEQPRTLFVGAVCLFCKQGISSKLARDAQLGTLTPGSELQDAQTIARKRLSEMRQRLHKEREHAEQVIARAKVAEASDEAARQAGVDAELARRTLAQRHLLPFVVRHNPDYLPGWVHQDICEHLEWFSLQVAAKLSPRLMICMPPRHGKSALASVGFPGWHLGNYPEHEIMACSYNSALAMSFSRKVRNLVREPAYQVVFDDMRLDPDSQSVETWHTTEGGMYAALGVGGPATGRGAHVLLIDDPVKNRAEAESETSREAVWDWYTSTAYTRLAPGGGVIVILTRWHDDDLAGRLLRAQKDGGDQWRVISYPAIAEALHPARYNLEALERIKRAVGPRDWQALYQQNPVADDGDYFTKNMITYYSQADLPDWDSMRFYTCWDLAIGQKDMNDWSVGITVGVDRKDDLYIVDIQRGRWGTLELADKILDVYETWRSSITGIERGQIEMAIGPFLDKRKRERSLPSFVYEPLSSRRGDKVARARSIQGRMMQHRVKFRRNCDVTNTLINELLRFPNGVNDDQCDALAYIGLLLDEFVTPRIQAPAKQKSWRDKLDQYVKGRHTHGFMGA